MLGRVILILILIATIVVCYHVVIWVLGLLGVFIPSHIITAVLVLLGLIAAYGIVTGKYDNVKWW